MFRSGRIAHLYSCSTDLLEKPFDRLPLRRTCLRDTYTATGRRCSEAMEQRCCPINNPLRCTTQVDVEETAKQRQTP
jgi:hypothetical protein